VNLAGALFRRGFTGRDSAAAPDPSIAAPAIAPVFGAVIGPGFSLTLARLQCEARNDAGFTGLVRPTSPSRSVFTLSLRRRGEGKEKARRAVSCA
jgi:hypothetical protein